MGTMVEEERSFERILEKILRDTGLDCRLYKPTYLKRRIAIRMRSRNASGYAAYWNLLKDDPRELDALLERLTVHVTEFFRDPEVFESFRKNVLPDLERRFLGETLRLWSAGCSTGEEPYSLALLLAGGEPERRFRILASDVDPQSVRRARAGEYPAEALRRLPETARRRWFEETGGKVRIRPEIRSSVRFEVQDVLADRAPAREGSFHAIFCRNLLIYLTPTQHQVLYRRFHRALKREGYLVLGRTEALLGETRPLFECVDVRNRIYRARLLQKDSTGG